MTIKEFSAWVSEYYEWCGRASDALSDFAAKGGGEITEFDGRKLMGLRKKWEATAQAQKYNLRKGMK